MTEEQRKSQLGPLEFENSKRDSVLEIPGISTPETEPYLPGSENVLHIAGAGPVDEHSHSSIDIGSERREDPRWRMRGESLDHGVSLAGQGASFQDLFAQHSSASTSNDTSKHVDEEDDHSDPLRSSQAPTIPESTDMKVALGGEAFIPDNDEEHLGEDGKYPPVATKRTSHLQLNIKPPSPQPWDLVDPPERSGSSRGHEFAAQQDEQNARPLIPKSSYYYGPPPQDSAFGTPPVGQIGVHHAREIIRLERDYTGGELIQFAPVYPLELEGRLTPTQFLESVNSINELLISAHSLRKSAIDNILAVFTLQLSRLFFSSHYDKEMGRLRHLIEDLNVQVYNPAGLNILWPRNVAFLFLEIEYYVSHSVYVERTNSNAVVICLTIVIADVLETIL